MVTTALPCGQQRQWRCLVYSSVTDAYLFQKWILLYKSLLHRAPHLRAKSRRLRGCAKAYKGNGKVSKMYATEAHRIETVIDDRSEQTAR